MSDDDRRNEGFLADCDRIHRLWHERARSRDTEGLLALYAADAVLESPLVPAILDDAPRGVLQGHREFRRFFAEGARRRPDDLVRWHRSGEWLTDGRRLLVWEYPRQTPEGDQVDLVEVMEIADGLIRHHRIYWGWFGTALLCRSAATAAGCHAGAAPLVPARNTEGDPHASLEEAATPCRLMGPPRTSSRTGGA